MAEKYLFKLYHSGQFSINELISNLNNLLKEKFKNHYSLETVNVTEAHKLAVRANVFMILTLVKQLPPPSVVVVGNLADIENLSTAIDISIK